MNYVKKIYEFDFVKEKPIDAVRIKNKVVGLNYKYFEGNWNKLPNFKNEVAIKEGACNNLSADVVPKEENFGLVFSGYINIPETGIYTFYLRSNDGSRLTVSNEILSILSGTAGLDPIFAAPSRIALEAGFHPIAIDYFQNKTRKALFVEISGPNMKQQDIPVDLLFRESN